MIWLWNIDYYVVKFFYTRTTQLDYNVSGLAVVAAIYEEFYYEMQRMKIRRIFF